MFNLNLNEIQFENIALNVVNLVSLICVLTSPTIIAFVRELFRVSVKRKIGLI